MMFYWSFVTLALIGILWVILYRIDRIDARLTHLEVHRDTVRGSERVVVTYHP
jgi:hypothetical protein